MKTGPIETRSDEHAAAVDSDAQYQQRHGINSLMLHAGRGRLFVCKHHDDNGAVLVELHTHAELSVTADEFSADFHFCFMDEAIFWCGSPEEQAAAQRHLDAHIAAAKFCRDQERSAPSQRIHNINSAAAYSVLVATSDARKRLDQMPSAHQALGAWRQSPEPFIVGPTSAPVSRLNDLTPDETAAMMAWADQQPRNTGDSIDLMGWPGWQAVMERRLSALH